MKYFISLATLAIAALLVLPATASTIPVGNSVSYTVTADNTTVSIDLPGFVTDDGFTYNYCEGCSPAAATDPMAYNGWHWLVQQGSALGITAPAITFEPGSTVGLEFPWHTLDPVIGDFTLDDLTTFGTYQSNGVVLTVADQGPYDPAPEPQTWALVGTGLLFASFLIKRFLMSVRYTQGD